MIIVPDDILALVQFKFSIGRKRLIGGSKVRWIVDARGMFCLLAHEKTDWSWPEIGRRFTTAKTHTTAFTAGKRMRRCIDNKTPIRVGDNKLPADQVYRELKSAIAYTFRATT